MRITFLFMLLSWGCIAQENPIKIIERSEGNMVIFEVKNSDVLEREVTFWFNEIKGFRAPRKPLKVVVASGKTERILEIRPKGGYSYNYGFTDKLSKATLSQNKEENTQKILSQAEQFIKSNKEIIVFSKDGCPRCHLTTSYLLDNEIDFQFINITEDKEKARLMRNLLEVNGVPRGKEILMPVVLVNGKLTHTHKDIKKFVSTLGTKKTR